MNRYKYSRTFHLPWSEGISNDDKVLKDVSCFEGMEVVITEKMDGSNCSLYFDGYVHGRSIDSFKHEQFNWLRNFWNERIYSRPFYNYDERFNYRIVGENLYAKHSIHYKNLKSYFYGFGFYANDYCVDWDNTLEKYNQLNIIPVPEIYRGKFDKDLVTNLWNDINDGNIEGYVIRNVNGFYMKDFGLNVAKFVRKGHVQTDKHWLTQELIKNELCTNQT